MSTATKALSEEFRLIPRWAFVTAGLLLAACEVVFLFLFGRYESNPPWLGVQLLIGTLMGGVLAIVALLAGYVNRDARRRGLNAPLWTLLVLFIPNAIGFVLYFLLRPPVPLVCPSCRATVRAGSRHCSTCGRPLGPLCPHCSQPVAVEDAYCPSCGQPLRQS